MNASEILDQELGKKDVYFTEFVTFEDLTNISLVKCNRCFALISPLDKTAHLGYHYITNQERNCP